MYIGGLDLKLRDRLFVPSGPFGGHATLATGLVSAWKLEEESGTRFDSVGSNDLTDNNTVGFSAGMDGNAANIDSVGNEWLSIADNASFDFSTTGMTLAFWFKGNFLFLGKDNAAAQRDFALLAGDFYAFQPGGGFQTVASPVSLVDSAWHFVIIWVNSADWKARIRVDGGSVVTSAGALTSLNHGTADFQLGRWSAASYTNGLLDETLLYSRALTTQEQNDLYNSGTGLFY